MTTCLSGTLSTEERRRQRDSHGGWLEENLHDLLANMLRAHRQVTSEIETIASVRKSTRVELYRRLSLARDYIESNSAEAITLDDMPHLHTFRRTISLDCLRMPSALLPSLFDR